jgi:dTDP-glucose 4,6-dehydratase
MKNVLVTGGAGFIGSRFVNHLLANEAEVQLINLDALTYAGSLENLSDLPHPERHEFIQGDICDQTLVEDLLRKHSVDTIVHFAAESHVDRSILGPARFMHTNAIGTLSLLEAARQFWLDEQTLPLEQVRFLHISTDEVYGSLVPDEPAFSETNPYKPNSPYAASKAASDHLVRAYAHTYGLPVLITNCSNNYGPHQFPEKLIPLMILNALEGTSLPIYGDGQQVRDWLYIDDHCEALLLVLRGGRVGETYNLGGGAQHTNLELVRQLCAILDDLRPDSAWVPHESLISLVEDRPGHDRRYAMDIRKIGRELGWQPRHSLQDGLRTTVEWYLSHTKWVAAVRQNPQYRDWLERNYAARSKAG